MAQLSKILITTKVAGLSLAVLLVACSGDPRYISEMDGDQKYLKSSPLESLKVPSSLSLPGSTGEYSVPAVDKQGKLGKQVNILPPLQPIARFENSNAFFKGNIAGVRIQGEEPTGFWQQIIKIIKDKGYSFEIQPQTQQSVIVGEVNWPNINSKLTGYTASYTISVKPQSGEYVLLSELVTLKQGDKTVTSPLAVQRYTVMMLNFLTQELVQHKGLSSQQKNLKISHQVEMSKDDAGLPLLVIRSPYNIVWEQLPESLKKIGMEIKSRDKSEGMFTIKYHDPGTAVWQKLAVADPGFPAGEYTVQLGDRSNRTTVQFMQKGGQVIDNTSNAQLLKMLEAALKSN